MTSEPPLFQDANRCDVCKCSFTTFRRRHHCRCCGRTLCHEHSTNQMPLPQFGIHSNVRVCAECFNESSRTVNCQKLLAENVMFDSNASFEVKERLKKGLPLGKMGHVIYGDEQGYW